MRKLEQKIVELKMLEDPIMARCKLFNLVRDIPYGLGGDNDPYICFQNNLADCSGKTNILFEGFTALGYKPRRLLMRCKLRDFPPEVKFIPDQIDYHHALEVNLNNNWIVVDATYDSPLTEKFAVNTWNGIDSVPLAEKPLTMKIEGIDNEVFDDEYSDFKNKLEIAYQKYSKELAAYTLKFNEFLKEIRDKHRMG